MTRLKSTTLFLLFSIIAIPVCFADAHNQLSEAEKEQGWLLLFNGIDLDGWQLYGDAKGTGPWLIEDGSLKLDKDVPDIYAILGSEDLVYAGKKFEDFELRLDWKISEAGNSGIFWGVKSANEGKALAMEMQVLDDDNHRDGKLYSHRAGDLYDLKASMDGFTNPVGDWNSIRLVVKGDHIEHWMNGSKVLEIKRQGEDWERRFAKSKFADRKGYGQSKMGHILLQDHWDVVWFRNIKILPL